MRNEPLCAALSGEGAIVSSSRTIGLLVLAGATSLLPVSRGMSAAREDAAQGPVAMIEEVTVTARKREERIQDIPESLTVFSAQDIENAGISRIADVAANVPNLILQPSYRQGVVNISARGLTTPQQGDSPVVLNIDGVQAPAQDFINQDLFDIERIEVLKGPQGALYGAGAIGGAINIITKRPSNHIEGFAKASYGKNEAQRYVAGLSGPLVQDRVLFRLAGAHERRDGYIRNELTGKLVDFVDETTVRGSLYMDLDALRIDLRASYMDGENGASFYETFPLLPDPIPEIDLLFGGPLGRLGSDISAGRYVNRSNVQTEEQREVLTSSLKIEYDLGGGVLTSVTGYNESNQEDYGDLDFQPADILLQDVRFDAKVFNTELRYSSDLDKRLRWMGGLFFQKREIYNQVIVLLGDMTIGHKSLEESRNNPANAVLTDGRDAVDSEAWGVFLSTNYDLTDALTLTAAARYDEVDVATRYLGADPLFLALPQQVAARTFQKLQPQLNLAYRINDDVMAYVDLARGFRTGVPNPTAAFSGGLPRFIEPEVADTAEVGLKNTLLGGRLVLNAALFYSQIDNRHHYFYGASLQSMTTYDEAEVYGLEVDLIAALAPGLRLQASGGLMSAQIVSHEITRYLDFNTGEVALVLDNKGNTLPDTPEKTLRLALDYEFPLTASVALTARAAYRYADRIFFDTENLIDDGGAKEFVDLRLGLRGARWSVTSFLDNATDERTYSNYAYSGGAGNYLPNRPRLWGFEVGMRF